MFWKLVRSFWKLEIFDEASKSPPIHDHGFTRFTVFPIRFLSFVRLISFPLWEDLAVTNVAQIPSLMLPSLLHSAFFFPVLSLRFCCSVYFGSHLISSFTSPNRFRRWILKTKYFGLGGDAVSRSGSSVSGSRTTEPT